MAALFDIGIGSLVKEGIGFVTSFFKTRQELKKTKAEGKLRIEEAKTEAKIRRLDTAQSGDIAWQNLSIENAGWKDEWFTIVLSIPAIMCFVPGLAVYVDAGFRALEAAPGWYRWCLVTAVASSFGYKKLADFMALKRGS